MYNTVLAFFIIFNLFSANNITCMTGLIKCPNNNICLSSRFLCDGDNDCGDNSDENAMFCQSVTCAPGKYPKFVFFLPIYCGLNQKDWNMAPSAGAAEYSDCIPAEG